MPKASAGAWCLGSRAASLDLRSPSPKVLVLPRFHTPLPKLQDKININANHFQGKHETRVFLISL